MDLRTVICLCLICSCAGDRHQPAPPDRGCQPACGVTSHCVSGACADNVCAPVCGLGEICLTDGADDCYCGTGPRCPADTYCLGGGCVTVCDDGLDNDRDGWVDQQDPDCWALVLETGYGDHSCNDGRDNDGDGLTDREDPACGSASADELLGSAACADECLAGATRYGGSQICARWDASSEAWGSVTPTRLRDRARLYLPWLRGFMQPAGGVAEARFTSPFLVAIAAYEDLDNAALMTGLYAASEAWRLRATGDPEAAEQLARTLQTMLRWWRIAGDPGYLARFAAPAHSPEPIRDHFNPIDRADHLDVPFEAEAWHWKSHPDQAQYLGAVLGALAAHDALTDEELRAPLRQELVALAEVLAAVERRPVTVLVDGQTLRGELDWQYVVFTDDETTDGQPELVLDLALPEALQAWGLFETHPRISDLLRELPGLEALAPLPRPASALTLGAFFMAALHVSAGVPDYAARRLALAQHVADHAGDWLTVAEGWQDPVRCGAGYEQLHASWLALHLWAALEPDPARSRRLREGLLRDRLWPASAAHKNPWFAFLAAAAAPAQASSILAGHPEQLAQFGVAPRLRLPCDVSGVYAESATCGGLAAEAVDVSQRVVRGFLWGQHPWALRDSGDLRHVMPGVDFLAAYWLARQHGFVADDAPGTCLRWRASP